MTITRGPKTDMPVNGALGEQHYDELMRMWRWMDVLLSRQIDYFATEYQEVEGWAELPIPDGYTVAVMTNPLNPDLLVGTPFEGHGDELARWSAALDGWEFLAPGEGWTFAVDIGGTNNVVNAISYTNHAWCLKGAPAYVVSLAAYLNAPGAPYSNSLASQSGVAVTNGLFSRAFIFVSPGVAALYKIDLLVTSSGSGVKTVNMLFGDDVLFNWTIASGTTKELITVFFEIREGKYVARTSSNPDGGSAFSPEYPSRAGQMLSLDVQGTLTASQTMTMTGSVVLVGESELP